MDVMVMMAGPHTAVECDMDVMVMMVGPYTAVECDMDVMVMMAGPHTAEPLYAGTRVVVFEFAIQNENAQNMFSLGRLLGT